MQQIYDEYPIFPDEWVIMSPIKVFFRQRSFKNALLSNLLHTVSKIIFKHIVFVNSCEEKT